MMAVYFLRLNFVWKGSIPALDMMNQDKKFLVIHIFSPEVEQLIAMIYFKDESYHFYCYRYFKI